MASSKLCFSLLASSIVRSNVCRTSIKTSPCPRLVRWRCSSSAAAVAERAAVAHPWPEWVSFVDHLKSEGYFTKAIYPDQNIVNLPLSYTDSKLLKDPCLSFARLRFDLIKLLSLPDIRTLVEKGCPNLFRKTVNSSKRLRAHLQLDEGKVCGACDLRLSCDRAYVILNDDEASARTVDILRVLLVYALEPSVISGGKVSSDRAIIEKSARKLLSELIELSETVPAPEFPINSVPAPRLKEEPLKFGNRNSQNVEMKSGDWICTRCNFMNYARNFRCLKCQEDCPKKIDTKSEMKTGDWNCAGCGFMNYAKNSNCFRCNGKRPPRQLKPGEWECPSCDYLNYRRNASCKKCSYSQPSDGNTLFDEEQPSKKLEYGEWDCPSCAYVNFRKNITCRKCNCHRPHSGGTLS